VALFRYILETLTNSLYRIPLYKYIYMNIFYITIYETIFMYLIIYLYIYKWKSLHI